MEDPKGDVLIVLGGSLLDKDLIGTNSYWRAIYGTLAWREGAFRHVIITGGGPDEGTISEPMQRFMMCYGVPAQMISVETRSQDTWENALRTKEVLLKLPETQPKPRLVLLTSDYHMFRAYRVFRKVGLDVEPRPFPDVIKRSYCTQCRWDAFQEISLEAIKIGYYFVRGRI